MQIRLNHLYEFDLSGTISFGDLDESFLYDMFKDGRVCCEPLSRYLEKAFDDLIFVDKKGYDYLWKGRKLEKKQVTNSGLRFCPSAMIGTGRKVDFSKVVDHIMNNELLYVIADITTFPKIRVIFVEGTYLLDNCLTKNCLFSKTQALRLFDAAKS